ncbi:MAG: alanine racemase [Actinobacteria bacterium]|nr:alanine racemase [Actinomycetota bacterium]
MVRPTYAEIDLGAVARNVKHLAELISPSVLCAVVKADAYGHGDAPVAAVVLESGASWLAVALVEEGIRLREAGIDSPILLLSETGVDSVSDIAKWQLTPTAYSVEFIDALAGADTPLQVHVKVDTGMHRVGAAPRALHELVGAVNHKANLDVAALWTHFPVADEDPEFTARQIEVFDQTVADLDVPMIHMANTAGAVLFPEARRDMCRIGLGLYGLHPCPETHSLVSLSPALRLITHVSHVQHLEAGARPSYGRIKELRTDSTVVTAPVGYADGLAKGLSEYGCALIGGHRFPFAGTVTMDQIVIDVGDADIGIGDEVVLLGTQGDEEVTAYEWAEELNTISYEIVCSISPRIPRRYVR